MKIIFSRMSENYTRWPSFLLHNFCSIESFNIEGEKINLVRNLRSNKISPHITNLYFQKSCFINSNRHLDLYNINAGADLRLYWYWHRDYKKNVEVSLEWSILKRGQSYAQSSSNCFLCFTKNILPPFQIWIF